MASRRTHYRPLRRCFDRGVAGSARRLLLPAVATVCLALAACSAEKTPGGDDAGADRAAAPPRATRGYVVISIDTLRADHLGAYGYGKPTSPFLDSLAARATLFEEAYAQYPSTLVSHLTMFTGLQPKEHGVVPPQAILADAVETFPEVFQRAGFRTAGYTEGGYMSGRYGFRRGFDEFVARDRAAGDRQLARTFARGERWLEGLGRDDRFLLFLHTYAVHAPYDAPETYQRMFWPGPPPAGAFEPGARVLSEMDARGDTLAPEVVDWLRARYDAGIRETDDTLRRFFATLERLGLADNTTVVLTADHGEEFLEHGRLQHSQVYREVLRVPLLVVHPDQRGAARREVVELADLAPTLYALARLTPGQAPSGESFAGLLGRNGGAPTGSAHGTGAGEERALYRGDGSTVESVLLYAPQPEEWVSRELVFDAPAGELAFEARAWETPRQLAVGLAGGEAATVALQPEVWTPIRVVVPAGGGRVRLRADGCKPDEAPKRLYRCLGFQVRGVRTTRVELYDVGADPGQRNDLAAAAPRRARELLRELLAFRPAPRARAGEAPPDPALEESLRALGYLQ